MKMKLTGLLICGMILAACNSRQKEKEVNNNAGDTTKTRSRVVDIIKDKHYLWDIVNDSSGAIQIAKTEAVEDDSLTPGYIIRVLNFRYPEMGINFLKITGDTICIKIPNSRALTSRLGSTGAENFMADVTYNLTELKNINYVKFDFKRGDHAEPGVYTKTDFSFLLK